MGLLRIDAQLTATELDDVDAVASAFSHLLGTTDVVEVTGDRSHHGAGAVADAGLSQTEGRSANLSRSTG